MVNSPLISVLGMTFNIYAVILAVLGVIFFLALWQAHKKKGLDYTDLITRDGTKVSTTKVLQLVGGVVGTWVVIQVTLGGVLTWDIFAIYLAYVASIDGFAKLIMAKYGAEGSDDSHVPYRRANRQGGYIERKTSITEEETSVVKRPMGSARTSDIED